MIRNGLRTDSTTIIPILAEEIIVALDLVQHEDQPHGKGPIKPRLQPQREHLSPQHHIGGRIHFPSNLRHCFLAGVEDRAVPLREAPFDLVLLSRIIVHLHRHARPPDNRRPPHAEDWLLTLRSLA